jgi:hypothetical protein
MGSLHDDDCLTVLVYLNDANGSATSTIMDDKSRNHELPCISSQNSVMYSGYRLIHLPGSSKLPGRSMMNTLSDVPKPPGGFN